jgi:hypothetical protein
MPSRSKITPSACLTQRLKESMSSSYSSRLRLRNTGHKNPELARQNYSRNAAINLAYLPIFLVIFYLVGYSFSVGYFEFFGIDADHFSRSYEGYATKTLIGYLGVLGIVNADKLNYFIFMNLMFACFAAVILYVLLRIVPKSKNPFADDFLKKLRKKNEIHGDFLLDLKISLVSLVAFFSPSLIFIISIVIVMYGFFLPYQAGREVAKDFVENAKSIDCHKYTTKKDNKLNEQFKFCATVFDSENKPQSAGFEIAASESKVALYNRGKVMIIWLKDGYRIERLARN